MVLSKPKLAAAALLGIGMLVLAVGGLVAQGLRQAPSLTPAGASAGAPPAEAPAGQARVPGPAKQPHGAATHEPILLRVPNHGIQPQVAVGPASRAGPPAAENPARFRPRPDTL